MEDAPKKDKPLREKIFDLYSTFLKEIEDYENSQERGKDFITVDKGFESFMEWLKTDNILKLS